MSCRLGRVCTYHCVGSATIPKWDCSYSRDGLRKRRIARAGISGHEVCSERGRACDVTSTRDRSLGKAGKGKGLAMGGGKRGE